MQNVISSETWEHFPHNADIGARGYGLSKEAAFAQVAVAMTAVITDPRRIHSAVNVEITCHAPSDETLLIDWLNAIVFEMATRKMLFGHYDVTIESGNLTAVLHGEPIDVARHEPTVEIKSATFTEASVHPGQGGGWIAQCVVHV